ncbi:unnamed protein product [Heterobilharzia americana]|nr:unnamed protein product [Heterobilharzia americana]
MYKYISIFHRYAVKFKSKKHKKDESNDVNVQIQSNHDKSSKKKSPFQTISTDFLQTTNNIVSGVNHSVNNDSSMPMMTHVITTPTTTNSITYTAPEIHVNVENNLPTNQQSEIIHHNNTIKGKKKRGLKLHSHKSMLGEEILKVVNKPIFGVSLDVAYNRNPSHDEVILPAFFPSEGIYRVPGVHSQVQAVISSIDNGQEFPDIPPTSAAFYHNEDIFTKLRSSHFLTGSDITTKGKTRHSTSSHSGTKEITSILLPKTQDNRGVIASPASFNFTSGGFYPRNSVIGAGSGVTVSTAVGSGHSPVKYPYSTSLLTTTTTTSSHSILPHDPAVIASVIKHFLRSLPEPILTKRLSNVIESLTTDTVQFYHNLSALIHQELPVSNRYLLAWIIQHMMHIIDRAGENRMTLANIIIVLSPCLGISHRLLSILLNPTPPENFTLDLCKLDPKLPLFNPNKSNIDPSTWHWLFPHPIYLLKPYIPPLKLTHGLELPDSTEELDIELKKQESLLSHLYEQIKAGETNPGKEYLLRDVQHIVTEIKRRKTLTDPEAIRQEIIKQQAQLDKLHLAIAQSTITDAHSDTSSGLSQSKDTSLPSSGQRRRITGSEKPSKSHHIISVN